MMEALRQCVLVLRKDLTISWRSRARFVATFVFGIVTLLLFSFAAGPNSELLRANAAGYLWLGILLASTLGLAEGFRVEQENGALEGLLLSPTSSAAVFYGKAIANLFALLVVAASLVPFMIALYDVRVHGGFLPLLGVIFLGTAGIAAPGTIHAALSSRARAADVLLPLLLFPLLVPTLLSAVRATTLVLTGDAMGELRSWMSLMLAFDVIYWALSGLLFGRVVED